MFATFQQQILSGNLLSVNKKKKTISVICKLEPVTIATLNLL